MISLPLSRLGIRAYFLLNSTISIYDVYKVMSVEKKVRKQIYLTPEQDEALKALSVMKGVSEASLIRKALDDYLAREKDRSKGADPLAKLVGLGRSAHTDIAENHDEYLYREEDR